MLDTQINTAVRSLRNGGIIAYPTEAVFGLGCDPQNEAALKKLITLKQRDQNKGLIIIASKIEQLYNYIEVESFTLHDNIKAKWPGPITWVMPCKSNLSPLLTGGRTTVAARVSAHPVVQQLCDAFEGAIVSTSANISGQTPIKDATTLETHFHSSVDTIIHASVGQLDTVTSIFDAGTGKQLR